MSMHESFAVPRFTLYQRIYKGSLLHPPVGTPHLAEHQVLTMRDRNEVYLFVVLATNLLLPWEAAEEPSRQRCAVCLL